jgi:hypothetical protein
MFLDLPALFQNLWSEWIVSRFLNNTKSETSILGEDIDVAYDLRKASYFPVSSL